jgi:glycosyltransferase involved in cell wall biosynthesis
MAMQFWVFSYNRGEFLKNCISSIEFCAPGSRIRIFDDNSNDPATRDALAELAKRHEVVTPDTGENQKNKHGGLYANMQAAFEACEDEDLVCYLQDDMQLVRPISPEEVAQLDAYLSHVETPRFAYSKSNLIRMPVFILPKVPGRASASIIPTSICSRWNGCGR